VRDDPRGDVLGLTTLTGLSTSQLISLVVGITSLIVLIVRRRRARQLEKAGGLVANGARA
jgi:Flp pilus assembly protein TadB